MRWSHIFKDAMCWSADDTPSAFFWDLPLLSAHVAPARTVVATDDWVGT